MRRTIISTMMMPACLFLLVITQAHAQTGPLPSWNDGKAKQSVIDFVKRVSMIGGKEFVPVHERIAVFDNDGTLWAEQPMYFQLAFAFDRVKALAPQHPEWKDKEPFKSVLKGDVKAALAGGEKALVEIIMATHAGMTTEEFDNIVRDWLASAKHPKTGRRYTRNGLPADARTASPICARTDSRPSSSPAAASSSCGRGRRRSTAFRRSKSSAARSRRSSRCATASRCSCGCRKSTSSTTRTGKPVGINKFIGRRPIAAFGNSDGDLQMLHWTAAGRGARFMAYCPSHRRRTRMGLRPHIFHRQARQGARRRQGERLDCGGHEERLEVGIRVREMKQGRIFANIMARRRKNKRPATKTSNEGQTERSPKSTSDKSSHARIRIISLGVASVIAVAPAPASLGCLDFMAKPLDNYRLLDVVTSALSLSAPR